MVVGSLKVMFGVAEEVEEGVVGVGTLMLDGLSSLPVSFRRGGGG